MLNNICLVNRIASSRRARRRLIYTSVSLFFASSLTLYFATMAALAPLPLHLQARSAVDSHPIVLANDGTPLSHTYANRFNLHDVIALHDVPAFLQAAIVRAEDKRFYQHRGVDWSARIVALWQNIAAGHTVRGASTISEQVVKMLNDRPRGIWTRWAEGFDAIRLERRFSKAEILEFYLNQLPYASNRRGIVQAARHYFDRSPQTLSQHEMLALAVLPRAPSRLDLRRYPDASRGAIARLAKLLESDTLLSAAAIRAIKQGKLQLSEPRLALHAPHFVRAALARSTLAGTRLRTTLDPDIQRRLQALIDTRLKGLAGRRVGNAAALVVEHASGAVRGWAVSANGERAEASTHIDAVLSPRQPGSTLKPFVYALALERGYDAATLIEDAPLRQSVGLGEHAYHNYSRRYYGPVTVRMALGNSLNIPAVRTLHQIGTAALLARLKELGISSLTEHPDVYGDGLALGNGEISLYELVQAYTVLANLGAMIPIRTFEASPLHVEPRVFTPQDSAVIANILADPNARALEFGRGGVLEMPFQIAVKTGTSSDYRDSWAVGFSHRYTIGVWMGNLDRTATDELTGSSGPALVLRAMFARLHAHGDSAPLPMPTGLQRRSVCLEPYGAVNHKCKRLVTELFRTDSLFPGERRDSALPVDLSGGEAGTIRIQHPSPNLSLARDPRIPDDMERYRFALAGKPRVQSVTWIVDGHVYGVSAEPEILWPLEAGKHTLKARLTPRPGESPIETQPVTFNVR